jgi:carboxymethylenebutenolidase
VKTSVVDLGHLAVPDSGGPGLVVVHDVWGLYDHYRDLATRFAGAGYVTLAIDLYRGMTERPRPEDVGGWMRELSDVDVLKDVQTAVDFLRAHPAVGKRGVGVVGFCMGGSYALLSGALVERVSAVAAFYGILSYQTGLYAGAAPVDPRKKPTSPLDAAERLRCPMIAFYGTEDPFVSMDEIRELELRAGATSNGVSVHIYTGAGHAFFNDTRPQAYRPETAKDAWAHLLTFFDEALGDRGRLA